ncbi:Proteasomal ATPase-associated factor 1 [Nymphon striatum]|nr:Proteasomal ATPase-associated factor 1 [Nymphon striatum]
MLLRNCRCFRFDPHQRTSQPTADSATNQTQAQSQIMKQSESLSDMDRPYLVIQSDWNEVLKDKNGEAWVSCYNNHDADSVDNKGIYGSLKNVGVSSGDNLPFITGSGKFSVEKVNQKSINIKHEDPNCSCLFVAPISTFPALHKKNINCLDTSSGGLGVSVCTDCKLRVWNSADGCVRRELDGHLGDVYVCKFFPSGLVILSGGADLQLRIWSIETGKCHVVLKGHVGAIHDVAIVGRGKNILSVSKDGTVRLWNCGSECCIGIIYKHDSSLNCCCISEISDNQFDLGQRTVAEDELEIDTTRKLLFVGAEDGFIKGFGLHSHVQIFEYNCGSPVNTCTTVSPCQVVCGTQNGSIFLFDITQPNAPILTWRYSSSPVLSVIKYKDGFFSSKGDGVCVFMTPNNDKMIQLTGSDCDPVYSLAFDGSNIFSSCRDGTIRKYSPTL